MKLHRINALLYKYWCITKNRLDRIFDVFYWPLIGMLVWGFTTYYIRDLTETYAIVNVFLGGAILWTFFHRANQDIAVYILEDFWSRNLYNLFASPITAIELITSTIILGIIRSAISFFFLAGIAFLLYSFNFFSIGILAISVFAFDLMLFGWVIGIFVSGLIFRYGMRIQIFAWSLAWLVQPFSAVFYPLKSLPQWLQNISILFPTTHVFEGLRYAFDTGKIAWANLGFALLLNIILLIIVYLFFINCLNKAKKTGLLTKYGG